MNFSTKSLLRHLLKDKTGRKKQIKYQEHDTEVILFIKVDKNYDTQKFLSVIHLTKTLISRFSEEQNEKSLPKKKFSFVLTTRKKVEK